MGLIQCDKQPLTCRGNKSFTFSWWTSLWKNCWCQKGIVEAPASCVVLQYADLVGKSVKKWYWLQVPNRLGDGALLRITIELKCVNLQSFCQVSSTWLNKPIPKPNPGVRCFDQLIVSMLVIDAIFNNTCWHVLQMKCKTTNEYWNLISISL